MYLKMLPAKYQPFCWGLNVLEKSSQPNTVPSYLVAGMEPGPPGKESQVLVKKNCIESYYCDASV